jgi:hypothetical protein
MRLPFKVLLIAGSLLAASLGLSASASAATPAPPTLNTSNFACNNGFFPAQPVPACWLDAVPSHATGAAVAAGWPHRHRDVSGGWLRPTVFGAVDGW